MGWAWGAVNVRRSALKAGTWQTSHEAWSVAPSGLLLGSLALAWCGQGAWSIAAGVLWWVGVITMVTASVLRQGSSTAKHSRRTRQYVMKIMIPGTPKGFLVQREDPS